LAVAKRALAEAPQRRPRGGRPDTGPVYTRVLDEEICDRLATGEALRSICRDGHMPSEMAVRKWVEARPDFGSRYTRAREIGLHSIAEEILEISDEPILFEGEPNNALVQHARLKSENRRWYLAKLMPKQYGDKVTTEITGEDGGALVTRIELVPVAARPRPQIEHDDSVNGSPVEARTPKGTRKRLKS
jgi:hypothetical protein